jgi:hypothetical protein
VDRRSVVKLSVEHVETFKAKCRPVRWGRIAATLVYQKLMSRSISDRLEIRDLVLRYTAITECEKSQVM